MTTLFTKSKLITLGICLLIIIMTSFIFLYGENKIDNDDIKTTILMMDDFEEMQTEDYYREKINNFDDSLIILKKDAMIHILSQNIKNQLGYPDEELINKNLFKFIHPKDLPFFANNMIDIIHEKEISPGIGPFRIKNNEGQYNMYMADGYPIANKSNEEITGIILAIKDIIIPVGNK